MIGNKKTNIKQRQLENKKLQLETKKMEEQLERIRKFKQMEFQKEKLKLEIKSIQSNGRPEEKTEDQILRGYGQKLKKDTEAKARKKLQNKKLIADNSPSSEQDNDSQNLKYFMSVLGLPQYFDSLVQNGVKSLANLRKIDEAGAKKIGIPLKDMIKINKKLRSMGY